MQQAQQLDAKRTCAFMLEMDLMKEKVRGGDGECQSADMNGVGVRVCLSE